VNEIVVESIKGIKTLPKVVGVKKTVVLIGAGEGGGTMPPQGVVVMGVQGLPDEVATFASIATCRIK
jgi:hypothetical protein